MRRFGDDRDKLNMAASGSGAWKATSKISKKGPAQFTPGLLQHGYHGCRVVVPSFK